MASIERLQVQAVVDKLHVESDRACAVLGVASTDVLLEELLRRSMVPGAPPEMFEGNGPFATFSAKIDAAFAFGLLPTEERRDLHILRKIRNDFAHAVDHELGFNTPAMSDRVQALTLPRLLQGHPLVSGRNDNVRWRFELTVGLFIVSLLDRIQTAKAPLAPVALTFKGGF